MDRTVQRQTWKSTWCDRCGYSRGPPGRPTCDDCPGALFPPDAVDGREKIGRNRSRIINECGVQGTVRGRVHNESISPGPTRNNARNLRGRRRSVQRELDLSTPLGKLKLASLDDTVFYWQTHEGVFIQKFLNYQFPLPLTRAWNLLLL